MDKNKYSSHVNAGLSNLGIYTHKYGKTAMGILAGIYLLAGPIGSYRGLYTGSDTLFKKVTLEQVNHILAIPKIANSVPSNSSCEYTEGIGGRSSLICDGHTVNFNVPSYNTTLYKCFDIQLDKNKQLNTSSGYCFRGSIINNKVVYHDSNGNPINKDFIPGKRYPFDNRKNQG